MGINDQRRSHKASVTRGRGHSGGEKPEVLESGGWWRKQRPQGGGGWAPQPPTVTAAIAAATLSGKTMRRIKTKCGGEEARGVGRGNQSCRSKNAYEQHSLGW